MSNNPTNNTLHTHLLFLLTGQCILTLATLTMATLIQEASSYLIKVTMGSQHLTSSHQLAVHIMPVFHHNITSLVLKCKDLVAKVIFKLWYSTDSQTSHFYFHLGRHENSTMY